MADAGDRTITWLHLSDMHRHPWRNWASNRVLDELVLDLQALERDQGLRPDLIFFTGDAAFGHTGEGPDERLPAQFRGAEENFFSRVRNAYAEPVPQARMFLVPGNHDVDRKRVG
jgi:predicted MPP superfamily phosphohydrolase